MKSDNKRLLKNTIAQYFRIVFVAVTSLVTVRIVLKELGIADYGIFSLIAGLLAFLSILTSAMVVSTNRYISAELANENYEKIKQIYSASVYIHLWLAIIVLIISETIGLYVLNYILVFSEDKIFSANIVYQCSIVTFILNVISIPQQGVLIAYEKLLGASIISCAEALLKLIAAFLLCIVLSNKLIYYALFTVIIAIIIRLAYNLYVIKTTNLKFSKVKREQINQLTSFAGWNLLGGLANIGKLQGTNIILNIFYNTSLNASFGIANQVNAQLLFFSSSIFQSSNSQTIQAYKKNDVSRLNFLVINISKIAFVSLFIVTAPIYIFANEILIFWLDTVPEYCADFLRLMFINSYIELFSTPIMFLMQANGRIKNYFISVSVIMLMVLPISYYLLKCGLQPPIVIVITILINLILLVIRLEFVRKVAKYNYFKYLKNSVLRAFFVIFIVLTLGMYIRSCLPIMLKSINLLFQIGLTFISIAFISSLMMFSKNELCHIFKR